MRRYPLQVQPSTPVELCTAPVHADMLAIVSLFAIEYVRLYNLRFRVIVISTRSSIVSFISWSSRSRKFTAMTGPNIDAFCPDCRKAGHAWIAVIRRRAEASATVVLSTMYTMTMEWINLFQYKLTCRMSRTPNLNLERIVNKLRSRKAIPGVNVNLRYHLQ